MLQSSLGFVAGESKQQELRPTLYTAGDGLLIETYPQERRFAKSVEAAFGFVPSVYVRLHLARGGNPAAEQGDIDAIRTVDWLINTVEGDAVLIGPGGEFNLLRKDGQIWLDHRDTFWRDEDLEVLTFPYEWKNLNWAS